MDTTKFNNYFGSLSLLAVAFFLWLMFAPSQLGGKSSYIIVEGESMLPTYRPGDLIITRPSDYYRIGDIVTYIQPEFGIFIIHRVVAINNDRYVTQGDNVASRDTYSPTSQDIVGRSWLRIPYLGNLASTLKQPAFFALAVGALGFFFLSSLLFNPDTKNKAFRTQAHVNRPIAQNSMKLPQGVEIIIPVVAVFFVFAFGLTIWSILTPSYIKEPPIRYIQAGQFAYNTSTASGIYDSGAAQTGDPIFTKITCTLNLSYAYALMGSELDNVAGTYQLYTQIMDPNSGWKKTVPLVGATGFSGSTLTANASIDLCQLISTMEQFERETGARQGTYLFSVFATVTANGTLQNIPFQSTLNSKLEFVFDRVNFYVNRPDPAIDPFLTSAEAAIDNPTLRPSAFSILGLPISVNLIRFISIALTLITGGILAYLLYQMNSLMEVDMETRIKLLHGVLIVDASDLILKLAPIIEFDSIDELAKLASTQNTAILRTNYLGDVYYTVRVGDISYRHIRQNNRHKDMRS